MSIKAFSSWDVTDLLGITTVYLNALVTRKLYGIAASISDRHGEIKVRIFSEEDVFGIALVWMLFEAGLRTEPIRDVLNDLLNTEEADANSAAEFLLDPVPDFIVVVREPKKPKGKAAPKLWVERAMKDDVDETILSFLEKHPTANALVVPVGAKFSEVKRAIVAMYGE